MAVRPSGGARWRGLTAVLLAVLAGLLAPVATVSGWARATLLDTDRYVAVVAPLAADPAVRSLVTQRVTDAVLTSVDIEALADQAVRALVDRGVPAAVAEAARGPAVTEGRALIRSTVAAVVASDAFAGLWATTNREVHAQLLAMLSGDQASGLVLGADGTVSVHLGPLIAAAQAQLAAAGLTVDLTAAASDPLVPVLRSPALRQLRSTGRLVDTLGGWTPWLTGAAVAGAVAVAPRRRRGPAQAAGAVAIGTGVLAAALAPAHGPAVGVLGDALGSRDAAAAVVTQLITPLQHTTWAVLGVAAVVAVVARLAARPTRGAAATHRQATNESI